MPRHRPARKLPKQVGRGVPFSGKLYAGARKAATAEEWARVVACGWWLRSDLNTLLCVVARICGDKRNWDDGPDRSPSLVRVRRLALACTLHALLAFSLPCAGGHARRVGRRPRTSPCAES